VSSKADDFDVRYRDAGPAGHDRPPADGGFRGNAGDIDYDLGYDDPGWDTQGFRRPEADPLDGHGREPGPTRGGGVGTAVRPERGRAPRGRRAGGQAGGEETSQLNWESEGKGGPWVPQAPVRGRRAAHGNLSGFRGARGGRPPGISTAPG